MDADSVIIYIPLGAKSVEYRINEDGVERISYTFDPCKTVTITYNTGKSKTFVDLPFVVYMGA